MANDIPQEAQVHIKKVPAYLLSMSGQRNPFTIKVSKIAETLKLMGRDQGLFYSSEEFDRDFGDVKKFRVALAVKCIALGLRSKVIVDAGQVVILANEKRS